MCSAGRESYIATFGYRESRRPTAVLAAANMPFLNGVSTAPTPNGPSKVSNRWNGLSSSASQMHLADAPRSRAAAKGRAIPDLDPRLLPGVAEFTGAKEHSAFATNEQ